jgi:hypothetical protein
MSKRNEGIIRRLEGMQSGRVEKSLNTQIDRRLQSRMRRLERMGTPTAHRSQRRRGLGL